MSSRVPGVRRQPRSIPAADRPFRRTERDTWILESLGKMRFLTTDQLAQLTFRGSRWAANKRLRKLLDARLVQVWLRDRAQANIYSLTRGGVSAVQAVDDDGTRAAHPRGLDGNLDHLLAINQVRVSLAVALDRTGGEIAWWRSDWERRALGRERVIPDAMFVVRWEPGAEQAYALEVDNQARSLRALLAKVLRYRSLVARGRSLHGVGDFIILVVGRDARWVTRCQHGVAHAGLQLGVWFSSLAEIETQGPLGRIWRGPAGDAPYSLREVAFLTYGKEGVAPASGRFDTAFGHPGHAGIPPYRLLDIDTPS